MLNVIQKHKEGPKQMFMEELFPHCVLFIFIQESMLHCIQRFYFIYKNSSPLCETRFNTKDATFY